MWEDAGIMGKSLDLCPPALATRPSVRLHLMRPRAPALGREAIAQHGWPSESAATPQLTKRPSSGAVMQPASEADATAADPTIHDAPSPRTDTPSSPARSPPSLSTALGSMCLNGECLNRTYARRNKSSPCKAARGCCLERTG